VHAQLFGNRAVGGVGDDVVDGMARRQSLAERERHRRFRRGPTLVKACRALLILVQEEAAWTEGLVEGVGRVKAHEWQLPRGRRTSTRGSAHHNGNCNHRDGDATLSKGSTRAHIFLSPALR